MPDLSQLREEIGTELLPYVELVHGAPAIDGTTFNSLALLRAVNGLWPLGETGAVHVLCTYSTLATRDPARREPYDLNEERVFLIARLLFVPKDGSARMPPMLIGVPDVAVPPDDESWPLFPLALSRQVPFLLVSAYSIGGLPQSPLEHLEYCLEHCRLRDQPLAPETCPLVAVELLLRSEEWQGLFPDEGAERPYRAMLLQQALRAMEPHYVVSEQEMMALSVLPPDELRAEWRRHVDLLASRSPEWDPERQEFVLSSTGDQSGRAAAGEVDTPERPGT